MTLGIKMKNKELPLMIRKEMKGVWTKEFESKLNDEDIEKKVEEKLKTKSISKDKDGYSYDE